MTIQNYTDSSALPQPQSGKLGVSKRKFCSPPPESIKTGTGGQQLTHSLPKCHHAALWHSSTWHPGNPICLPFPWPTLHNSAIWVTARPILLMPSVSTRDQHWTYTQRSSMILRGRHERTHCKVKGESNYEVGDFCSCGLH